jgi:hypothetical protein
MREQSQTFVSWLKFHHLYIDFKIFYIY